MRAASAPLIRDLLASGGQAFSFEFMPPKTEAEEHQLWRAIRQLEPLRPTFVSVTYGAGGATRDPNGPGPRPVPAGTPPNPGGHPPPGQHPVAEPRPGGAAYPAGGGGHKL